MTPDPRRIAMWSGPRNLSTAMMYAFAARGDCAVVDEPFYGAYLNATGLDHPMKQAVIAAQDNDPLSVGRALLGAIPQGQSLFYQKHMTLHMIPAFDRGFLRGLTNVFLIRHPARVIASYVKKRESPSLADIGFVQQAELFDDVANDLGHAPIVISAEQIRAQPERALAALCRALGIGFTPAMLHWPAGPKLYDGVWAPHWYNAVHASTGFGEPEPALSSLVLPESLACLSDAAQLYYEKLSAFVLS